MASYNVERKFRDFQRALDVAYRNMRKRDYAPALMQLNRAKKMMPDNYETNLSTEPFAAAYCSGLGEIKTMETQIREGVTHELRRGYEKAVREIGRMERGGRVSPTARKTIVAMEKYMQNMLAVDGLPEGIKQDVEQQRAGIQDLREELETLARTKGKTIDWNAD